jgi:signal transduction histidine kinase
MSGSVGHELRTPLATISNAIYYLKMVLSETDENVREYLEIIASETRNSEKIISDLLDFSRIKSVNRENVMVSNLVTHVLERRPPSKRVQVSTAIAPDLPAVFVDPRQIEQVLLNLVTNAYQAMPNGGKLTITATLIEGDAIRNLKPVLSGVEGSEIRIQISDTGCGISEENMKKLFEPLFTTKAQGIGLGLVVCKNLIEANGGSIEVESEEGQGSTFALMLPKKEKAIKA